MFLLINDRDPRPAYQQIAAAVKEQIRTGTLHSGDELPSVRELARDLGINLHTARHAYQVLSQENVIYLRLGRRARVAPLRGKLDKVGIEVRLTGRLQELITDAYHMGMSAEQFCSLVDDLLKNNGCRRFKQ